jgi:hypothetical protein
VIYSKFGCELTVTGHCGDHKPKGWQFPVTLLRAVRKDDGAARHYLMAYLRADGGIDELEAAAKAAPVVVMPKAELKAALDQAM